MKISAIKKQQKDANRVSVFVDGKYSFSLTLDQLIEEKLRSGLDLDEPQINVLKKKSADGKLRIRVIEWLAIRPRSEKELRLYLIKKNVDKDHSEKLISEMQSKRYLSDEIFCRWFTGVLVRRLKSSREISFQLKQKGISEELITQELSEHKETEENRLKEVILKKRKTTRFKDNDKLMAYLVRKGYSFSDVKDALADG